MSPGRFDMLRLPVVDKEEIVAIFYVGADGMILVWGNTQGTFGHYFVEVMRDSWDILCFIEARSDDFFINHFVKSAYSVDRKRQAHFLRKALQLLRPALRAKIERVVASEAASNPVSSLEARRALHNRT